MARIELRRHIRAPAERIWPILTDFNGQVEWMEDVHKLDVVYRTADGPGTVITATTKLFGLPVLQDVMVITRWEESRALRIVHCGQFSGWGEFRLEPAEDGADFVWEEVFHPPLGPLGELVAAKVIGPHLRRVWARSMDNVARLAEQNA